MNKLLKVASIPFFILPSLLMADDSETDRFTHELYTQEEVKKVKVSKTMETINKEIESSPSAAGATSEKPDAFESIYGVNIDDAY
jgi:hypothetical protein